VKIASTAITPIGSATLDGQVHLDGHVVGVDRHKDEVLVDDLDVGRLGDVGCGDRAGPALDQAELDGVRGEALEPQLLDVEDDLRHVFLDAWDRRELLVDVADLDARDRGALERGQKHAPQRVAEGDAITGLEGAGFVLRVRADFLDRLDLRILQLFDHVGPVTSSSTRPRAAR
jgi:hypothetical protein